MEVWIQFCDGEATLTWWLMDSFKAQLMLWTYLCACPHTLTGVCAVVWECTQRPETNNWCLPWLFSTVYFETGVPPGSRAWHLGQTCWPMSSRELPALSDVLNRVGYCETLVCRNHWFHSPRSQCSREMTPPHSDFPRVLGIQIQALMLVWQALHWPSDLRPWLQDPSEEDYSMLSALVFSETMWKLGCWSILWLNAHKVLEIVLGILQASDKCSQRINEFQYAKHVPAAASIIPSSRHSNASS